jgi:hypothetical protein
VRGWILLLPAGAAGLLASIALTGPAHGDLLPTLPVSVPTVTLPVVTTPPPVAPPPVPPVTTPPPAVSPPPPAGPPPALLPPALLPAVGPASTRHTAAPSQRTSEERATRVSFRLRRPGTVRLVVSGRCGVVARRQVRAHGGVNRLAVRRRRLQPGRYTVTIAVRRQERWSWLATRAVTVPGRAPGTSCVEAPAGGTAAAAPPALVAAGSPLASGRTSKPSVSAAGFLPPRLPSLPHGSVAQAPGGGLSPGYWAALGAAAFVFALALMQFFRTQWPR